MNTRADRAVQRQLQAMAVDSVEIGVLETDGLMQLRTWPVAQIPDRMGWLRWRNTEGAHIFVRPLGSVGLVLVDDLTAEAIRRMVADRVIPAVVVETSPANHQAWVRVAGDLLAPAVATAVAKLLAQRYDGDPHSADWHHFGRLAGTENRKEKYRDTQGRYPWVRVRSVSRGVALAADRVLEDAAALVEEQQVIAVERFTLPEEEGAVSRLGALFRQEVQRLEGRYVVADWSRVEWMIVLDLARRYPSVTAAELGLALYEGGAATDLAARKQGHVADYIARTIAKALAQVARERASRTGASLA